MKLRRILSLVLALMMVAGCAFAAGITVSAEENKTDETAVKDYSLGYSTNDGLVLQAWNWSYSEIEKNLEAIAEAGFTTIQISPPTELKEATVGVKVLQEANDNGWWMMYQPAAYELNQSEDNVLGTKDELVSMIDAAHELGLFIIADAVINHLGNSESGDYKITNVPKDANAVDYLCQRAWEFDSSKAIIEAGAFHYPYANCQYNDKGAFDCTQNAVSLLPDLDTSHPVVQETILDYWHECIDAGIDGFRIDAAKHIETKYDGEYASDFWDVLMYDGINGKQGIYPYAKDKYGKDLYMYGEILNTVSTERSFTWYLEYMNITNSTAFYAICDAVNGGNAQQAVPTHFNNGMTSKTAVLWDESHDTYMDGCKANNVPSVNLLTKRWACMASRADVVSMYLARPTNTPKDVYNLDLGVAYDTAWNDKETAAINKFHNHFQGAGETVYAAGNIAVIERADSGVVLVNCKGNTANVDIDVKNIADGTYTDQMSGTTFTVANGKLTGSIGSTGVAVVYNPETPVLEASVKTETKFTTDTITVEIVANGTDEATYSVNNGEKVAFTGKETVEITPEIMAGYRLYGVMGDADYSDNVNVKDATLIQKATAGLETLTDDQNILADVDKNGNVNVKDATAIQKHVAGLESGCDNIGEVIGGAPDINGEATLTLQCGDYVKEYTYWQINESAATVVKYDNSDTQWTHVYCYAFLDNGEQNNAWPGILMTKGEDDIWYYEIPAELEGAYVVFSDNILGTGQQTGNLPTMNNQTGELHSKSFIFTNDVWNAIDENGNFTEIGEEKAEYYIVFADKYNWKTNKAQKIRYYATGGGPSMTSPGIEMEAIGTDENGVNLYGAFIDRNYTTIKFYCTNKSNIQKETQEVYVSGHCGYYPLAGSGGPDCGTFEVTPPAA
ncbi:MAG: starch-binding protein [Ruminococcaceae bacterium]|nr:starch-binding protein [Oscillospiraceae bacterium]